LPFLVGGSPHYIQAVVDHLAIPAVPPQPELRAQLEARPLADLLAQLEQLDPQAAVSIDRNNPRRVMRALEVCLVTGQPFSEQRRAEEPLYRSLLLGLSWPREVLYARLEALGLEYRYISRWLRGELASEAEMVQRLKYAIHDFTRRQLTWFRKDRRIVWIEGNDREQAEAVVKEFLSDEIHCERNEE
jgi:tRNA dimethylallyltransferase